MNIYFDIETIPSQSPTLIAEIRQAIKPPGTIKKQESIDAWLAENADQAAADQLAKTSFDPALGQICTIGWAIDGGEAQAAHAFTVDQEADVLRAFFASIPSDTWASPKFIGHYISGFDIRFVLCRAVILGVRIPPQFPRDPKPWSKDCFDTMTAWAGSRDSISQDKLAKALGLEGKKGFDGSMVAEAWANGEHQTIIDYCKDDVETVRAIHRRFESVGF